jgi:hypothetical protein
VENGRKDPEAYTWFVNVYLKSAVGKGYDAALINNPVSKVFTKDDEAVGGIDSQLVRHSM